MTYEEAINELLFAKRYTIADSTRDKALDKAIDALEKQIPKKPIHITRNEHSTRIIGYGCPNCHKDVIGSGFHCWNCGQEIDWSDER